MGFLLRFAVWIKVGLGNCGDMYLYIFCIYICFSVYMFGVCILVGFMCVYICMGLNVCIWVCFVLFLRWRLGFGCYLLVGVGILGVVVFGIWGLVGVCFVV